jgi:hypothetical protein
VPCRAALFDNGRAGIAADWARRDHARRRRGSRRSGQEPPRRPDVDWRRFGLVWNIARTLDVFLIVRTPIRAAAVTAMTLGLGACVIDVEHEGETERVERRFPVAAETTAELRLQTFDGSIEVRTWDRPEVLVYVDKRGEHAKVLERIEVLAEQKAGVITVEARDSNKSRFVGIGFSVAPSAKMVATVPRRANLVIRTPDGSIIVERVEGRVEVHTGDGSIRVAETSGELLAETGDGSIQLDDVRGNIEARTSDGTIRLSGMPSRVRARSGDGSIVMRIRTGATMTDDWMIATDDGSVAIELPEGFAAQVEAESLDGRVRNDLPLALASGGTAKDRTLTGTLGAGGRKLTVRTGDGTIRLSSY